MIEEYKPKRTYLKSFFLDYVERKETSLRELEKRFPTIVADFLELEIEDC